MIEISTEKGTPQAYLALPPQGTGPGVLLLHAWWGLNPFFIELADRLANEGFVVLAPDLNFGKVVTTVEDAEALHPQRDDEQIAATVLAACNALASHEAVSGQQIGVVGFSFGASWAIWLSSERPENIAAVALFYGAWAIDFSSARAAYLGHFAENDEWEPNESVQALEQAIQHAGRDLTLHTYPGVSHWFMENNRPEYNAEAAALAWQRTTAFLHHHLGQ